MTHTLLRFVMVLVAAAAMSVTLQACGGGASSTAAEEDLSTVTFARRGGDDNGIGVNSFLWRATLDTLDFMPMQQLDPFGGVVLTEWYANPEKPDERFKATVYILDARLRADAIKVSMFRQVYDTKLGWIDASVDTDTAVQIENAILTRARQLKIATLDG